MLSDETRRELARIAVAAYWQEIEAGGTSFDAFEEVVRALVTEQEAVPFGYFHELTQNGGGVWFGCTGENAESILRQSHVEGETGGEVIALYRYPPLVTVPKEIAPADVPTYWQDKSSNACAYAAGWNKCARAMLASQQESNK